MTVVSEEIKLIGRIISQNCNSEKIILFGSYAKGTANNESDIDICILTDSKDRKLNIIRKIRKALYEYVTKPVDLLVYNPQEFSERANASLKFYSSKIKKGGKPSAPTI